MAPGQNMRGMDELQFTSKDYYGGDKFSTLDNDGKPVLK